MRRVVGLMLPLLLLTAACSGSSDSPPAVVGTVDSVTVTGPTDKTPEIEFKAPLTFEKNDSKVVTAGPGTGPAVEKSSLVTVQYAGWNASDETQFATSWNKGGADTFYVNSVVPGFTDGLLGAHAGDRVLIVTPSKDAFGTTGNVTASVRPNESVIFVVDVIAVAAQQQPPSTVPSLEYDSDGNPSKFTAGPDVLQDPSKLGVYTLVEGTGPAVKSDDSITVEYFGQIYPDGDVFNAWTGEPFNVQLGADAVIKGWDQGLVGQKVGSRVVLVVPPSLAYGKKEQSGIPANSTLIFTVQILSVD